MHRCCFFLVFFGSLHFDNAAALDFNANLTAFPNIGYLGVGYDMLRSNPRPLTQPFDTGYASAVFDMTKYGQGRMTADRQFVIPDFTDIKECTACQMSYKSSVISGAASYKNSLKSHVSINFNLKIGQMVGANFNHRASESYLKSVRESENSVFIDQSATCLVYCAELQTHSQPTNLHEAFIEAVGNLPINSMQATYDNSYNVFLRQFGTHVVTSMKSGSLYWQRAHFSSANFSRFERETQNAGVKVFARLPLRFLSGSSKLHTSAQTEVVNKAQSFASSISSHSIGAPPPDVSNNDFVASSQWLEKSRTDPMPVELHLTSIAAFLTENYFPDDADIEAKQRRLIEYIESGKYCTFLATNNIHSDIGPVNCGDEKPDETTEGPHFKSNFGGTYYKAGGDLITDIPNQITGEFRFRMEEQRFKFICTRAI